MKVSIKNVQSIKNIDFEIKGFTCIVGKSNIGKSAILRAIRNLFKNKGGLQRNGTEFAEVHIEDTNLDVLWKKGEHHNYYLINGVEYDKLNREVPPPIAEAGIKEILIGSGTNKEKIDVQTNHQFSPLFLIDQNGREIAEILSTVSRLDVISKASRNCQKDLKNDKGTLKLRINDLEILERKVGYFKNLDGLLLELNEVKKLEQKQQEEQFTIFLLKKQNETYKNLSIKIATYLPIRKLKLEDFKLNTQATLIESYRNYLYRYQRLKKNLLRREGLKLIRIQSFNERSYQDYINLRKMAVQYQKLQKLKQARNRSILLTIPQIKLKEKIEALKALQDYRKQIAEKQTQIKETRKQIEEVQKSLQNYHNELHGLEKQLDHCPLCGSNIHHV